MNSFDIFKQLSVALTGFTESQLFPPLDPKGLGKQYFNTINEKIGADDFNMMLSAFNSAPDKNLFLEQNLQKGQPYAPVLQNIIKMWYFGIWFYLDKAPDNVKTDLTAKTNTIFFPRGGYEVISSEAYTSGLMWQAMDAHPMGYSEFKTGYWAELPPQVQKQQKKNSSTAKAKTNE